MLSPDILLAFVIMVSLTIYVLSGGADYGGGVWDLLATGPRAKQQRDLIAHAIGPIWEANHVWLILVIVVLFTAFPAAFALISISLHIPLVLLLIGIVLRGSAFTFRAYDSQHDQVQQRWGRAFAITSLLSPLLLGVIVGAISSGTIGSYEENLSGSYFLLWMTPFCFFVGLFAVVLFAFLAAVYLTVEAHDPDLQTDFRNRAVIAELLSGVLAIVVFILAGNGAPEISRNLAGSSWSWALQILTACFALGALWTLGTRRFRLARVCAAGQVTLILWGWGVAQYPFMVRPTLTIHSAIAPEPTPLFLLWTLAGGTVLLLPSYWYLFKVFKAKSNQVR